MFGSVGGPELLLLLVLALIIFGPRKLPEIGKSVGRMLMEFRKASTEFRRTIEDEVETEKRREEAGRVAPLPAPAAGLDVPPAPPPAGDASATATVPGERAAPLDAAPESVSRDAAPEPEPQAIQPK
jgi:TatA/E family protein of Tat protein translocase